MTTRFQLTAGTALVVAALWASVAAQGGYDWHLPPGFPAPRVPSDNPMSAAKVELGRHLFYDTRLSGNGTQSCASCHLQSRAFADGRPRGVGSTGEAHPRGPMSLVNIAYAAVLTWSNPTVTTLEGQALAPMFGTEPIELGLDQQDHWIDRLRGNRTYASLFAAAYPDVTGDPISRDRIVKAIATFERTIIAGRSPYDRYHFDRDDTAISDSARRGERLYFSRPLRCFTCHGGFTFADNTVTENRSPTTIQFHNTGLYNLAGTLSYPEPNTGIHQVTHDAADVGKFKAPTLRNIAVTAPYMHDGSIATLDGVIDHYAAGGRTITDGALRGVGRENPNKDPSLEGFTLTAAERRDLIAFLESLTDEGLLTDPRFANPWPATPPARR